MPNIRLHIPVTPPGTMGTTKGCHFYAEVPDQSSNPTARMDGVTLMDGTSVMQADWAPLDLGKMPYVAAEQPFVVEFGTSINPALAHDIRLYVSSYSDEIDLPLVRYGSPGATPSIVVSIAASASGKPLSGSNVTPYLVTGISASVAATVPIGGKLRRPISVTVDLSGMPVQPADWAYQLLGFANGDTSVDPVLASGYFTTGGLVAAGPDGISTAHTFGPEEPTAATSITIYAVAGRIAGDRYIPGSHASPGQFIPNNIVPGITASAVISIGTTTGVTDPTKFIQTLLDTSVGVNNAVFGVLPLGIDSARIALLAVDTTKLAALAVTAAKLGSASVGTANLIALAVDAAALATSAVTSAKIASAAVGTAAIANLAVGTAAIQTGAITTALIANAAITNALIANLAVGTAQIQALAVGTAQIANASITDAKIVSLDVSKLTAGTIVVSGLGTAAIAVQDSGSSAKSSIFAGSLVTLFPSGAFGMSMGSGAGGNSSINLQNSSGGNIIELSTFVPGLFINGTQVVGARYTGALVTLSDVIACINYHGLH